MISARAAVATLGVVVFAGSAAAQQQPVRTGEVTTADQKLPLGHGTLNQDVITIRLRSGELEIRITPLDERLLPLLVDDAYLSLQQLLEYHGTSVDSIARRNGVTHPGLALVSFFARSQSTRFDPTLVTVSARNRQLRPVGFLALSPAFSAQQLDVRQQASALFVFDEEIPIDEPLEFGYLDARNDDWSRLLQRLDSERGRIRSRVGSDGTGEP